MTFSPPKAGHLYIIRWGLHRTEPPPNGMDAVQFKGFALSTHPDNKPTEVEAFFQKHGYGTGWCCYVQSIQPPPRRMSESARGSIRTKRLEKRVAKTIGPLFRDEVIQETLAQRPDYFSGKGNPEQEARIAASDAQDAELWEEFQAWARQQHQQEVTALSLEELFHYA